MKFGDIFEVTKPAALFVPYPFKHHHLLNIFCKVNELEVDTTSIFMFWITYYMCKADPTLSPGAIVLQPMNQAGTARIAADLTTGSGVVSDLSKLPALILQGRQFTSADDVNTASDEKAINDESAMLGRKFFTMRNPTLGIFRYLLACFQIKDLSSENIDNYFRKIKSDRVQPRLLIKLLSAIAPKLDLLAPEMQKEISEDVFMQYHTSASSTPQIIDKMIKDLGEIAQSLFSLADIEAVRVAKEAPYDLSLSLMIPDRMIAIAHAYLSAGNNLPQMWYQGNKAKDSVPKAEYDAVTTFFKRLMEMMFRMDKATLHTSVPLLMHNAPAVLKGGREYKPSEVNAELAKIQAIKDESDSKKLVEMNKVREAKGLPAFKELPTEEKLSTKDAIALLDE